MLPPNPYRPGAGHPPPHLAGRSKEKAIFEKLLNEVVVTKNLIITGLRGVGKTVLLDSLKPIASKKHWIWTSTDLSESASINEESLARRIITDIALVTSEIPIPVDKKITTGFVPDEEIVYQKLDYRFLSNYYNNAPGLVSDKLTSLFVFVWEIVKNLSQKGIIFAYDEAQTMDDHAQSGQFPLSVLLGVFQSIQKRGIPFLLILTGLPTLAAKLVETRTYSERMFNVITLDSLNKGESREAIVVPLTQGGTLLSSKTPLLFSEKSIDSIIETSGGYPYFIQFICKEAYEALGQKIIEGITPSVPIEAIVHKLDEDFFSGRWVRATERQQDLLRIIARLNKEEITPKDIADSAHNSGKKVFRQAAQIIKMLGDLTERGLVYKNKRGVYRLAVPMLGDYIRRNFCDQKQG
ncbi:MAG: ATP-binding protein [Patescibacteria group bacterium]